MIGKLFSESLLVRTAGLSDADLAASLNKLQAAEFIYGQALFPEVMYAFKHPLTQDVAYGSQLSERRAGIHTDVARGLEELHADKIDQKAGLLAHHWKAAGEVLIAAHYHRRAAEWVMANDQMEALRHWRSVLALTESVSGDSDALQLALLACSEILQLGWRTGLSKSEIDSIFDRGKCLSERSGDSWALSLIVHGYSVVRGFSGDLRAWSKYAQEAANLADNIDDPGLRMYTQEEVALTQLLLGDLSGALDIVDRNLEFAAQSPDQVKPPLGTAAHGFHLWLRGELLTYIGQLQEAMDLFTDLERIARDRGTGELLIRAMTGQSHAALHLGQFTRALADAQVAMGIAENLGTPLYLAWTSHLLGMAYLADQLWDDAIVALETSLASAKGSLTYIMNEPAVLSDETGALLYAPQVHAGFADTRPFLW